MPEAVAILVRFALYLDLMLLFGLPLFRLYGLRGVEHSPEAVRTLRRLFIMLASLAILLSVFSIALLAASMSGVALTAIDRMSLWLVISGTSVGTAWQIRCSLLLLVLIATALRQQLSIGWMVGMSLLGATGLATMAWGGHGSMDEGIRGVLHLGADIIHLLAAGAWVAALLALVMLLFQPHHRMSDAHVEISHRALASFAVVGSIVVGLLLLTGLVNSWLLVGPDRFGSLLTSLYGQLLLVKLLLFVAMLGLAAANRFYMTPALEQAITSGKHATAVAGLRKSLVTETACALAILGLVAWLGMLAPPASGM